MHYLSVAAMTLVATFVAPVAAASRCGPGRGVCPGRKCCSARGFCAITVKHCGVGCQTPFGYCFDHPDRQRRHKKPGSKLSSTRPTSKKPAAKKSTVKKSAAKKPAAKKSAAKKSAARRPATSLVAGPSANSRQTRRHVGPRCGPGFPMCANGGCCSSQNVCGLETDMCEAGCQSQYGECMPGPYRAIPKSVNHQSSRMRLRNRPCTNPSIRREFRELTQRQRADYIRAIRCLQTTPSTYNREYGSLSLFSDLMFTHYISFEFAHHTAMFLPWHRVFMQTFEDLMRDRCGYKGSMAYWDWSLDSQAPERSEVWSPNFMGGNGDPVTKCVTNGPFAGVRTQTHQCIRRDFVLSENMYSSYYPPSVIASTLMITSFLEFSYAIEQRIHNLLHYAVGGDMHDSTISSNDPIFFLHHTNIDRLYSKWQDMHPHQKYEYSGKRTKESTYSNARTTDHIRMWGMGPDHQVKDVLNTMGGGRMCYRYSNSVVLRPLHLRKRSPVPVGTSSDETVPIERSGIPVSGEGKVEVRVKRLKKGQILPTTDRKDQFHLRAPVTLPDGYYTKMKVGQKEMRNIHRTGKKIDQTICALNDLTDSGKYISPSALAMSQSSSFGYFPATNEEAKVRDDILTSAVETVQTRIGSIWTTDK
ncbi:hypothetical protein BDV3_006765 [Batrachochytrium dendrobatidis]|uniref:Chitin-binding type-1 domain-containing protein n=1 Tax=Batrachochytrium dendrobatidis (strain JEL423) TaxID=403673 RepID=A0A177WRB5_BATDL|nr:hypothetical protein BDEG_26085 [Batrachochytrium dendrobatidis JEL423]